MWSSGPISHGQFSGKAWREQVMTRQPAAEKRLTVACPMPRLAPVSRRARRGWLECDVGIRVGSRPHASSRIEPRLAPRRARRLAGALDPVGEAERAVLPKLDRERRQAVAGPIRWSRYGPDGELGGEQRDRLFERVATLEWRRLLAGPGADLGKARAGGEIGIGLGIADPRDRTA